MASLVEAVPLPYLPDYALGERLGTGGYGTVYKARHRSGISSVRPGSASFTSLRPMSASTTFYAIKCIARNRLKKVNEDLLVGEIKILKEIKHENIVEMYDFRWDEHYVYIIMEYCSGGDLSMFLRSKQKLSEGYARIFLQQLAKVLKFLHEKQISHMDLKPGNILLKSLDKPILKVADFGMAQRIGEEGGRRFLGTPMYMAPEILDKTQPYDGRVDLWSIGVILYECLFGQPPFTFFTVDDLLAQIQSEISIEIPTDPPISPECRSLLEGLLQRDPNQRISFEEFFQHPFIFDQISAEILHADECLQQAIQSEQTGDFKSALDLRLQALDEYAAVRRLDTDPERRHLLTMKINQEIVHAEHLKKRLRETLESPTSTSLTSSPSTPPSLSPSSEYFNSDKELSAAYQHCLNGDQYMNSFAFGKACEEYEIGLTVMLRIAKNETDPTKTKVLHRVISNFLNKAERCKKCRDAQRWDQTLEKIKKDSFSDASNSPQSGRQLFSRSLPTCCLQ